MFMICEKNSFNGTPKEVDIETTTTSNVGHKKLVEHFLKKQILSKDTPSVNVKDQHNICDIMNDRDMIFENKDQSLLIEKISQKIPNFDVKKYIKENTRSSKYTEISTRIYAHYPRRKNDDHNIKHRSEKKFEKCFQDLPILQQYIKQNLTTCSISIIPKTLSLALIACYDRVEYINWKSYLPWDLIEFLSNLFLHHGCYDETLIIPASVYLYAKLAHDCLMAGLLEPKLHGFYQDYCIEDISDCKKRN